MSSSSPARRAASTARCGPFSGTIRPIHTARAVEPAAIEWPTGSARGLQICMSTALGRTSAPCGIRHELSTDRLTATTCPVMSPSRSKASCIGPSGGQWSVVIMGALTSTARSSGTWLRLWLRITSNRDTARWSISRWNSAVSASYPPGG